MSNFFAIIVENGYSFFKIHPHHPASSIKIRFAAAPAGHVVARNLELVILEQRMHGAFAPLNAPVRP
jgi:hypothetical protein